MFYGCQSLTSLDLSNFNTENVWDMNYMFTNTYKLREINFENIDTSSLEGIGALFYGCENLGYINFKNFEDNWYLYYYAFQVFEYVPENIVVCIEEPNSALEFLDLLEEKSCYTIYCGNDWKSKQKKNGLWEN